jgi:hypothetical protein
MTAAKGIASCEICVPNWLTVSADQSFRKSEWRQRPPRGHRLRTVDLSPLHGGGSEEREGKRLHLPVGGLGPAEIGDEPVQTTLEAAEFPFREPGVDESGLVLLWL